MEEQGAEAEMLCHICTHQCSKHQNHESHKVWLPYFRSSRNQNIAPRGSEVYKEYGCSEKLKQFNLFVAVISTATGDHMGPLCENALGTQLYLVC